MFVGANRAGNDEEDVDLGESVNTELEVGRRGGRAVSNFRTAFMMNANRAGNDEEDDFLGDVPSRLSKY